MGEASALTHDIGSADRGSFAQQTDGIASRDASQPTSRVNAASQTEYGFSDLSLEERMDGEDEYNRRRHVRARSSGYERSGPTRFGDNPIYVDRRRRDIPPSGRDPPARSGPAYGRESGVRLAMPEDQDLDSPFEEELYPSGPFDSTRASRRSDAQARPRVSDRGDDRYNFDYDMHGHRFDSEGPAARKTRKKLFA